MGRDKHESGNSYKARRVAEIDWPRLYNHILDLHKKIAVKAGEYRDAHDKQSLSIFTGTNEAPPFVILVISIGAQDDRGLESVDAFGPQALTPSEQALSDAGEFVGNLATELDLKVRCYHREGGRLNYEFRVKDMTPWKREI